MTYRKPELRGHSAITAIQETGIPRKISDFADVAGLPSDPAYQADE